ncbi:hypothetical protein B0T20DRAFT_152349 [Sordaria brevicollis]|uniref:Uncharacterized protein n=1 Tax=Sordaria brevicollis TaxID=83679 RepID=A0AAE0PIY3_SORBR|nr:hypothetical protein B0T20DRAFT_152349 [Sordaria brevicollis]
MEAHSFPSTRQTPTDDGPSEDQDQPPSKKATTDSLEEVEDNHNAPLNEKDINKKKRSLQTVLDAKPNYLPAVIDLWKDCHRFYQRTPFTLFPPESNLQYDDEELWTEPFCSSLRRLLWFPPYVDNIPMLAVVLQYAIICQTEDTRPWSPCLLLDDEVVHKWFLTLWKDAYASCMKSKGGTGTITTVCDTSPWVIHRFLRDKLMTTNVQRTSMPSVVFSELEDAFTMEASDVEGAEQTGPYLVTEEILTAVLQAMDAAVVRCGMQLFPHGEMIDLPAVDAPWRTPTWLPN